MDNLLEIRNLHIHYITDDGTVCAVNGAGFSIGERETVGLVGETGAGKTTTAYGILQLVPDPPGKVVEGEILYKGEDLLKKTPKEIKKIRGEEISIIFQDPMTALNPIMTVGDQIAEVIYTHEGCSKADAVLKACEMLEKVGIPAERSGEYPHQFSGGMKQRVVIAIALACNPKLLLADEPTTALDVTIQAQVIDMMNELKNELGTSVLLITHDLGIVAEMCDKVAIMYAGEIVEFGNLVHIFDETAHPYTKGLFESIPRLDIKQNKLKPIRGLMPDPADLPKGCNFAPRCPYATDQCREQSPEYRELTPGHFIRCFYPIQEAKA